MLSDFSAYFNCLFISYKLLSNFLAKVILLFHQLKEVQINFQGFDDILT